MVQADAVTAGQDILAGGGEMGSLMRRLDWPSTLLGPPAGWPQALRTMVRLLLTTRHPMFVFWGAGHTCLYNDAYRFTMGPERHPSALGRPAREVWDEIWPVIGPQIDQVMSGGEATWHEDQLVPVTRHGRREDVWWTYGYSPIDDPTTAGGVGGVLVVCNDVTREHIAREQLKRSEERTRLALSAANSVGTWDWDVAADRVYADSSFANLYGVEPAHAEAGTPIAGFVRNIHPDDVDRVMRAITEALTREGDFSSEYRLMQADGSIRWVAARGRAIRSPSGEGLHFPGVTIDITERKRIEDRLRELNAALAREVEQRERDLLDSRDFARLALSAVSGVGVWTYDVASDRFFCDAAVSGLYGLDAARAEAGIERSAFLANMHTDDRPDLQATMAGGLVQSGDLELEYRISHPDGSTRWVLSRGHTYFNDAGHPVRRVGIGVDMTKQRLLEGQLRQSQKMEAVGQLTGGLAHDFNNLLTGIMGSLELLQTRVAQGRTGELDRYVTAAQGAARRAAALTHRLLAFSRRQTLAPKSTDVNRLVAGMEELIRRTMGPAIVVETLLAPGLWTTLVDPSQLENALLNLCINARDAMPDGGLLSIETGNHRLGDHGDLPPGEYVYLRVTDTGSGMTPDIIARAFDPFFTTKPIGMGTGLGLSMIYGFARQSGGDVRIDSDIGRGTTVCINLPGQSMPVEPAEIVVQPAQPPRSRRGETVLVIDDEATVRAVVGEILQELGYTAIEAADGPSGLKVLQSDAWVDLLVTDVGLPGGMNGRQIADAARVGRPNLKILFITGYAENAVLRHGDLDAAMHVLIKPFSVDALATRIKELMNPVLPS